MVVVVVGSTVGKDGQTGDGKGEGGFSRVYGATNCKLGDGMMGSDVLRM